MKSLSKTLTGCVKSLFQRTLDFIEIGEIANRVHDRFAMDLASENVNFLAPNLFTPKPSRELRLLCHKILARRAVAKICEGATGLQEVDK
jgi:hypothetical protein